MTTTAPRAIRHFGLAAMEARAQRHRRVVAEPEPAGRPPAGRGAGPPRRGRGAAVAAADRPVFLLLAPFAILLIPLLYLAPPLRRLNCAAAIFAIGDALLALGGTDVFVDTPEALVRIKIF